MRGTLAGTLKKRLGLTISSSKDKGGQRVYRIESTASVNTNTNESEVA